MTVAKVKDSPGLVRDMSNQAVLNTDNAALEAYRRKRNKQKEIDEVIEIALVTLVLFAILGVIGYFTFGILQQRG